MNDMTHTAPQLRGRLEADLSKAEAESASSVEAATLRLIMCAVHDRDAEARSHDECKGCDDTVIRGVLELMLRQREESAKRYSETGETELVEQETAEAAVIREYLPKPLNCDQLEEAITEVVADLEANGLKDLGRSMTELKSRYPDMVDCGQANKLMKKALMG